MPPDKHLVTAAVTAACLSVASVAFGVQPVNKPVIHGNSCGNNGNGNGNEALEPNGNPPALCFKFVPDGQDPSGDPGSSCTGDPFVDIDPTCKVAP